MLNFKDTTNGSSPFQMFLPLTEMLNVNTTTDGSSPSFSPSVASSTAPNAHTTGIIFVLPQYAKMIFYVLQCVLVFFGLIGNVLVILSVRCNSRMKKCVGSLFIMNLAIADICVLVVGHTFILGLEIREFDWPFGAFACRALYPLSDAFYGVSIWSIVAISFHRYRGIVHPMGTQLSMKRALVMLLITWLTSILLITLPLWRYMELHPVDEKETCHAKWPNPASFVFYNVSLNTFFFVLPLALILYFYYNIRVSLKQSSGFHLRMTKSISQSALRDNIAKRIRENAKALRILTPVVVVFFITILPFTIFRLLLASAYAEMSRFPYTRIVFISCLIILLANSSANPVIYTIVSPEFRRSFMRFLGMKRLGYEGRFLKQWRRKSSPNVSECLSTQLTQINSLKSTNV